MGTPTALLVDGDNVPADLLGPLLDFLQRDGPVTERRIFRNWRSTKDSQAWDAAAKRHAFERIDRYKTTEGKNASDIAVAVAAMDLFHAGVRGFCIASGDTDFAPLVERLRRGGSTVVLVGHKADGGLLAELGDRYLDWRSLMPKGHARAAAPPPRGRPEPKPRAPSARRGAAQPPPHPPARLRPKVASRIPPPAQRHPLPASASARAAPDRSAALRTLLVDSYEVARTDGEVDAQGWVAVDRLGQIARGVDPGFTPAKYGMGARTSLTRIFERMGGLFEVQAVGRSGNRQYRVRLAS
jgi:hypothetical protein